MKFCSECGAVITEDAEFCEECGTALRAVPSTTFTPELFARVRTSGKAIFSLVLGIGCFFLLAISFFMGILSLFSGVSGLTTGKFFLAWFMAAITCVVLGHMAQSEIQSSRMGDARLQGAGVAVAGLILGYLQLGLVVLAIVFAVAIPNLMRFWRWAMPVTGKSHLPQQTSSTALWPLASRAGTGSFTHHRAWTGMDSLTDTS